jgi:hypothetical protein
VKRGEVRQHPMFSHYEEQQAQAGGAQQIV